MKVTVWYADSLFDPKGYTEVVTLHPDAPNVGGALDMVFRAMNGVDGTEANVALKVRSMSVGDIAEIDGALWRCENVGWSQLFGKALVNPHTVGQQMVYEVSK